MRASVVACLVYSLPWFYWDRDSNGWAVFAAWLLCGGAQLWLVWRSRALRRIVQEARSLASRGDWNAVARAWNPSNSAAIVALLSPLLIPATAWLCVQWAIRHPWTFLMGDRGALIRWMVERTNSLNLSASMAPIVGAIAAIAWGSYVADALCLLGLQRAAALAQQPRHASMSAPFRAFDSSDERLRAWLAAPGPERLQLIGAGLLAVATGLTPLCMGVHEFLAQLRDTMNCRAERQELRLACVQADLDSADMIIEGLTAAAALGCIASGLVICAVLIAPVRRRRRAGVSESRKLRYAPAVVCASLAVVTLALAQPYAAENSLGFPVHDTHGGGTYTGTVGLGDMDGPDELLDGPWIDVSEGLVDGIQLDMEQVLRDKKELWKQLYPGKVFPGVVAMRCGENATVRQLTESAAAASRAGYGVAMLVVARRVHQTRPVLGEIDRGVLSGIHLIIGDERTDITLSDSEFQTCAELMRAAATLRRQGKRVRLAVSESEYPAFP